MEGGGEAKQWWRALLTVDSFLLWVTNVCVMGAGQVIPTNLGQIAGSYGVPADRTFYGAPPLPPSPSLPLSLLSIALFLTLCVCLCDVQCRSSASRTRRLAHCLASSQISSCCATTSRVHTPAKQSFSLATHLGQSFDQAARWSEEQGRAGW